MKVLEKKGPMSLMTREFLRIPYIQKIFVVGNDGNRKKGALKIVFSLRKSENDSKEFVVINIIVAFGERECFREVGTRI